MSAKSASDNVTDKLEAELLHLIETIEPEKLQAWLLDRTPSEIKTLAPRISRAAKDLFARTDELLKIGTDGHVARMVDPQLAALPVSERYQYACKQCPILHRQSSTLGLALMVSGTLTDAKESVHHQRLRLEHRPLLLALLQKFKPSWLPAFVDYLLDVRWTPMMTHDLWKLSDDLIRTQTVPEAESPTYALAMVISSRERGKNKERGALAFLRSRPHLLVKQVWRLFELEANGPSSIAAYDALAAVKHKRSHLTSEQTWCYALCQLSREGLLDRTRLLDASLDAMLRDFPGGQPLWYARFHEALEPTPPERRPRVESYLKLLSSLHPSTVRCGLEVLPELISNSWVSDEDLLAALRPTIQSKHKVTAAGSFKYLEAIAKRRPELRQQIMLTVVDALALNSIDLQKRILKFLMTYPEGRSNEVVSLLAQWRDSIAPSLNETYHQLVPEPKINASTQKTKAKPSSTSATSASCLSDDRRIHPIASLEELIDAIAGALENPYDIMGTERILDGMLRIPAPKDGRSTRLFGPVAKRARHLFKIYAEDRYHYKKTSPPDFGKLLTVILSWTGLPQAWTPKYVHPAHKFHFARLEGIRGRVLANQSLPLLCTPTHEGFWIEPETLVQRAFAWHKACLKPALHDFVIALLRLPPEKREGALRPAALLTEDWGMALRYGLGETNVAIGNDAPLWIAASRARHPGRDDNHFYDRYPDLGPGAGKIGHWRHYLDIEKTTNPHSGITYEFSYIRAAITPAVGDSIPEGHFTVALHTRQVYAGFISDRNYVESCIKSPDMSGYLWLHSYWPSDLNAIYGIGSHNLANHFDLGSDHRACLSLFTLLADPLESYGPNALFLLSLGLISKNTEARIGAVQAVACGVAGKRLAMDALARSVSETIPLRLFNTARLHRALGEWARISDQHSLAVVDFLVSFLLASASVLPDSPARFMSFLHESLIRHKRKLEPTQASAIQRLFPGQNQASKLARQIAIL